MLRKKLFLVLGFSLLGISLWAQDLDLNAEDLLIDQLNDGGFHLYVRKKPGIGSVLLTETTRDPELRSDNYAYRALQWNPVNGDEIRIIDGQPIPKEDHVYSLIDSNPEDHPLLGTAFHIFIPWILTFGYENTRHGEVYVSNGTYLNIRTFALPYGDYQGSFRDNPFMLQVTQKVVEAPPGYYVKEAVESFREIAKQGGGLFVYSAGPEDVVDKIKTVLEEEKGKSVDIVLCLDTTASMRNKIDSVKRMVVPMLRDITKDFIDYRLGLVLYKDYLDEYLNKVLPFTRDFAVFQRNVNSIQVRGGGDLPEAVYEALYEGITKFPWEAESRVLILIGDGPPHPRQRGKISKTMVEEAAAEQNIKVSAIILPP